MKLHVDSPFLIIIFILLSFVFSFFTYRKHFNNNKFSKNLIYILFILRFFSFFMICFLFLEPSINLIEKKYKKPKILFFQDNSSSITANQDSIFYKKRYPDIINSFLNNISEKYQIESFSFGEKIEKGLNYTFSENQVNAILELKLRHLAKLEEKKIKTEQKELTAEKTEIEKIREQVQNVE